MHVRVLSVKSIERLLENGINRLAVLYSSIAPAILEAHTWSHFGLEKREKSIITHANEHILQNSSRAYFASSEFLKRIGLFSTYYVFGLKVAEFYSEYKKGV